MGNKIHSGKMLGIVLILSVLLSFGGCTTMMNYMLKGDGESQNQSQQQQSGTEKEEDKELESASGTEEAPSKEEASNQKPSSVDEELMSDYFVAKMELLAALVSQYYMNDISVEDMRVGAYKGLLEGLGDPYTCYYTAEEFDALMETTSGTYYGIGAVVQQDVRTMYITIVKPYVDGPAYNAGMLPGDIVYMVDGVDITGMEIDNVVAMMKGPEGTVVNVSVIRDGESEPVELSITRAKIEIETVEYEMLENQIGYIQVSSFDEPTPKQFKEGIQDLQSQGMKGLVIDMRDNPGGLLDAVVEMLDYILPKGLIVYTEDKYGNKEEFRGTDKEVLDMPIVVMTNGNSASASEIFAAAMQDYKAATLVGTTTFGKGIVQTIQPLTDGTAVKITISRYYTPNGICIHGTGVTPDVEVPLDDSLKQMVVILHDQDNQLQEAVKVLMDEIQ